MKKHGASGLCDFFANMLAFYLYLDCLLSGVPRAGLLVVSPLQTKSLLWYSRAREQIRADWHSGSMLAVPGGWFHQHFNLGPGATRIMAVRWGSYRHRLNMLMGEGGHGEYATISIRDGGNQVGYEDEDPCIRQIYEAELTRRSRKMHEGLP